METIKMKDQKPYTGLHKILYTIIVVYFIYNQYVTKGLSSDWIIIIPGLAILFFILENNVVESYSDQKSYCIWMLRGIRMIQITITMFIYFNYNDRILFGISLLCLSLFMNELTLTFDIWGKYPRIICCLFVLVPMLAITILLDYSNGIKGYRLFDELVIYTVFVLLFLYQNTMSIRQQKRMEEEVLKQKRLTLEAQKSNEELQIHQEKIKKTNELLGEQKIKLEEANKKINRAHSEMSIQTKILASMNTSLEIEQLMDLITASIYEKLQVDVAAIFLEEGIYHQETPYAIHSKLGNNYKKRLISLIERRLFDQYITNNQIWLDNKLKSEDYTTIAFKMLGSLILVPLISEGERVGVLMVGDCRYDFFTENNTFFETIAGQFTIALKNAKLYTAVKEMAIRDGLTGIYNRRYLTEVYNEKLQEVMMRRNPMSVAIFDIDRFKMVNDTYGHLFGDKAIIAIAKLAEEMAEKNAGMVGRFGGEEFVFIFPDKGLTNTMDIIKEFHKRVREMNLTCKGENVKIRVSVGVTSYPETCKNPADLLSRADWAMYYSKQNGRDRITVDFEGMETLV